MHTTHEGIMKKHLPKSIYSLLPLFALSCYNAQNRTSNNANCDLPPGAGLRWSDARLQEPPLELHETFGRMICGSLADCKVSEIDLWSDIPKDNTQDTMIDFEILIDSTGTARAMNRVGKGLNPTAFSALLSAISQNAKFYPKYSSSRVLGAAAFDSTGNVSIIHLKKVIPLQSPSDSTSLQALNDSINRIARRAPESILREIRRNIGAFRKTYLAYNAKGVLTGSKLALKFTINKDGRISRIEVPESNTGCPRVDFEIMAAAREMTFDSIEYGNTTVTYKFILDK